MPSERVQRRIDRLLDQAEEAADRGDWEQVRRTSDSVLAADPDNDDAKTFLAMAIPHFGGEVSATPEPPEPLTEPTAQSDQPTSFASGRYIVSKFLGEGGKKRVYLAHDNTLDRDVAFALIKTEGLDETSRERVKREAQAMGRMGTHPSIMPIYDLGEENGQPFMVQPFMGGGDVEGLVEEAEGALELDRALEITTQTAQGLSFAHSKGIVHRDLKPGNVWLDEDGAAKIGDFGLAVATDRSRLTVEKVMVGTVSYMPPEQATGGDVTPRADLYSLGAMLYEMCTGRVPFMGDDDIGVISQHINTPPVAPSWHNNQIPKTLDSLILRLLAKDPTARPDSADEVLAALDAVDLTAVEEREEEGKGSLDAMAGGVFVGRHREMDQLKSIFEDVLSGKGRMVTLVGEPGIGKTRTAQELATYAGMRGAEVLWGRSYESGGAPPYWPWVQAIRSHIAATEPQALRDQMGSTAPVIAEVVSDLKAKLPDLPAPTLIEDPESARFRLFDSISTFLKQISSATPLVLMLEDLHWSDKPSLMLLEFVARELANSRILIVGNYRDMELNRRHPLSVTLGDLTRERLFERVVLRGLQKHDVERFIEIAAGVAPPAALVDTVFKQTEGNPLFVTETVRLLIQEGEITSGQSSKAGTTSWEIRIPEGVREVIGRRLDRLSERCNEVLTTAAVVGRQFRFPVLLKLSDEVTENMLLDVMDEAVSARVIEELPEEIGLYQFTHALMQETLTTELSANRTVRMHAQIAGALEQHYGDDAKEHAAELVEHFAEAEVVLGSTKFVKYCVSAGKKAMSSHSYVTAEDYFNKARINFSSETPLLMKAEVLSNLGAISGDSPLTEVRQTGWEQIGQAFDYFVTASEPFKAIDSVLATVTFGGLHGLVELTGKALKYSEEGSLQQGYLFARHAVALAVESEDDEADLEFLDKAMAIAKQRQDHRLEARILVHLGQRSFRFGDVTEGLERFQRADALSDGEDLPTSMRISFWTLPAYFTLWDSDAGLREWARTKPLSRRMGSEMSMWGNGWYGWMIPVYFGDWDGARAAIEEEFGRTGNESTKELRTALIELFATGNVRTAVTDRFDDETNGSFSARDSYPLVVHLWLQLQVDSSEAFDLRTLEEDFTTGNSPELSYLIRSVPALAHENIREMAKLAESLAPYAGIWSHIAGISVDHVRGLLYAALSDHTESYASLQKAADKCRHAGYKPSLATVLADTADLLITRNAPGDREKATELQDEAISIATELGMKPLLERVLAKREILKA